MYRPKVALALLSSLLVAAAVAPVANAAPTEGTWENIVPPKEMDKVVHVAAVNDTDAWVFGFDAAKKHVATHWDGSGWSPTEMPKDLRIVRDSVVRAPDDVWVAGMSTNGDARTLILTHWDGHQWSTVDLLPEMRDTVRDMTFVGEDLWLAGGCCGYPAWLARFDGTQWSRFELPGEGRDHPYPMAVAAGADGSLYSAGFYNTFNRSTAEGATPLPAPDGSAEHTMVQGMASLDGGKTIWASGVNYTNNNPHEPHPQLFRWDDTKWTLDPYGADLASFRTFGNMTRSADALYVLAESDSEEPTSASIHRFNGSTWSDIAPVPFPAQELSGTADGRTIWAAESTPYQPGTKLALYRP